MTMAPDRSRGVSFAALVATVQHNCDLGDAQHARDGALCTYLLAMREMYRWSAGAPFGAVLERAAVGGWIAERESTWDRLCDTAARYRDLPIAGGLDVFDDRAADAALAGHGLTYAAGIGAFGAPVIFLGERLREEQREGTTIVIAGTELARGLLAPPAASRDGRVVVRTDALRRWLWTRFEAGPHRVRTRADGALIDRFGATRAEAIERLVREQTETLVLHELGEVRAAEILGPDWERMLAASEDRQAEAVLRAVRDLLADCLVTLPALIDKRAATSLLFWYANLEGVRRALAPRLVRHHAPFESGEFTALATLCAEERAAWERTGITLRERWRAGGATALRQAARDLLRNAQS